MKSTERNIEAPKYSIIVPTFNGVEYLPTCITSIISQGYSDYELIISDDHSVDGTKEYLRSLSNPKIRITGPLEHLSMTEHWEWALEQAKGEWCIFVGQDDGLQPYFFQLADKLTEKANELEIRSIAASRAYFFWDGCQRIYGNLAVSYFATNKIKVLNSKFQAAKALFGIQDYFELPQMYTTSLFKVEILKEARLKQNGKVFLSHPQDANLAAIACSLENHYLKSYIPLGWVGSSPKSAGMAIASSSFGNETNDAINSLTNSYLQKIANSPIDYNRSAGDFKLDSSEIYFWQALLGSKALLPQRLTQILNSKLFKYIVFGSALKSISFKSGGSNFQNDRSRYFSEILEINNCNTYLVRLSSVLVGGLQFANHFKMKASRLVAKLISIFLNRSIKYEVFWKETTSTSMQEASNFTSDEITRKAWLA